MDKKRTSDFSDCAAFGHLAQFAYIPMAFPQQIYMKANCPNLLSFLDRMRDELWPDWEEMCSRYDSLDVSKGGNISNILWNFQGLHGWKLGKRQKQLRLDLPIGVGLLACCYPPSAESVADVFPLHTLSPQSAQVNQNFERLDEYGTALAESQQRNKSAFRFRFDHVGIDGWCRVFY